MEEEKIFCFVGYRKAFEKNERNSNGFFFNYREVVLTVKC